jgi:hypothetical protein
VPGQDYGEKKKVIVMAETKKEDMDSAASDKSNSTVLSPQCAQGRENETAYDISEVGGAGEEGLFRCAHCIKTTLCLTIQLPYFRILQSQEARSRVLLLTF